MKYKGLIFPLMLLALGASVFYLADARAASKDEYAELVDTARLYAENGIYTDAVSAYRSAIDESGSMELALEAGEIFTSEEDYSGAVDWYEDVLSAVAPKDARTYEYGISAMLKEEDYAEAFAAYDLYAKRCRDKSEKVEEMMAGIEYAYKLSGSYAEHGEFSYSSGLAAVSSGEKWGYISRTGSSAISKIYAEAGLMGETAPVVNAKGAAYYISTDGTAAITHEAFEEANPDFGKIVRFKEVSGGYAAAYNGKEWAYFDAESKKYKFGGFKEASLMANGIAAVTEDGKEWHLIDSEGKKVGGDWDEICLSSKGYACASGAVIARKGSSYQLIGTDGERIGDASFSDARAFEGGGAAAVKKAGKWTFVKTDGTVLDLGPFDGAKSFSNGYAAAEKDGLWGFVDESGEFVVEPAFADAGYMTPWGTAFVNKQGDSWSLLSFYKDNH